MMKTKRLIPVLLVVLFLFTVPMVSHGQDITVTNTNDSGAGSLRQAITDAAAGNEIGFAVSGTITLSSVLTISKNLTITGPGADQLTISGNNSVRVFETDNGTINMSGLTIANGSETSTGGGGLHMAAGTVTVTVTNCAFTGNDATGVDGGAIFIEDGALVANGCTFSGNSADFGAAVSELNPGTGTYTSCTFSGNNAADSGGALYSEDTTLLNCTIAYNNADSDGGALQEANDASITNCIISNNTSSGGEANTSGNVTSGGYNVVDNNPGVAWTSGTGDQLSTAPTLNALTYNGGTTQTHSLQGGSPALNPASSNGAPTTDQRGYLRNGNADIGAYESSATEPEVVVRGNGVSIGDGDTSPDSGDFTDFGNVDTASGSQDRTFTIQNTDGAALRVYTVIISGTHAADYSVTTQPTTPVAGTIGSTNFTVHFDPSSDGVRSATLTFANNDSSENPFNFDIQGTGTSDPTISGNAGAGGVTLGYTDGGAQTATADGSGNYSFTVSNNWSGIVTPSLTGYTFIPPSRTYTNVLTNQTSQDYTATPITYTISGNAGAGGVTLGYNDGGAQTATADGSGNYSFSVSYNWSGTVTPSLTGYTFTPTNIPYTNVLANQTSQDYTATPITPTISGNAGVAGVTLSYIDGGAQTATADGSGNYSFTVSYDWTGTVTPSLTGYTFAPANIPYTNVIANQTSQDYTPTAITYTISGNAGAAGVTLSYTDGGAQTATADGSGNYSFTVSYNWTGTVTPSLTGYTFAPTSTPYTNVLANQTAQDYTATPITYTISGNAGIAGVTLSYTDGGAQTATADGSGNYSFTVSYNWSGTVTPSLTGYSFTPTTRTYTNVLANQTSQDYVAGAITPTISGNAGAAGVTLSYTDGGAQTATADGSGNYSFTVTYDWSGTVTPSLTGYTFTAVSRTYANVVANQTGQDYTANAITYTISGNAGIAAATLGYTDGGAQTATADGSGNYSFTVSYNWSGTVTPSLAGYTFTAATRTYTNVLANQTAQDYTAAINTFTITGTVTDGSNPVSGVTLTFSHDSGTATSDASGNYTYTVDYNTTTTVTPTHAGYDTFTPATLTLTAVTANQTGQDFVANNPEMALSQGATAIADGGSHDFGSQALTSDTDLVFTITNSGGADLTLTTLPITIGGTDAGQFSIQAQPTSPVAASGTTTFTVRFTPTTAGAKTATISIANNDDDENPYDLTITGTGTEAEMDLSQGGTAIADGGTHGFGSQALNSNTDVVFTITNSGTSNLTLTTLPITIGGTDAGQFSIQAQPTSPVAASGTTTFTVRFTPTTTGAKTATISIANNDADENPYDLTITGTGAEAEMALTQGGTAIADGGTHDFGSQGLTSDTDLVFTITNSGTSDLTLTTLPIAIGGTDADQFSIRAQPTSPVAASGTTTFTVRFTPTTTGAKTATISIANNDADENPYDLTITGVGVSDSYTISGTITEGTTPLEGVTVTFSHDGTTTTTDASGNYSYTVDGDTTTTVTPTFTGYTFTPTQQTLTNITEDKVQDFSGVQSGYTVSGTVTASGSPLQGVSLTFSHDSHTATTGVDGTYAYTVPPGTDTVVTPVKSGYAFTPANYTYTGISAHIPNQDFSSDVSTISVVITSPGAGAEVTKTSVTITTEVTTTGTTPKVKFYIDGTLKRTDSRAPYSYRWRTRGLTAGNHTIKVVAYTREGLTTEHEITVNFVPSGTPPHISLNRDRLNYGMVVGQAVTGSQTFQVNNTGGGVLDWTASAPESWISVTPTGGIEGSESTVSVDTTGKSAGSYSGTITVTDAGADNSPVTLTVYLDIKETNQDLPMMGSFDSPTDGSTVAQSVPVTGWALDDTEVASVKIYRNPESGETGLQYVGDAVFAEGARPDIVALYPAYPKNYMAGWGYMMLTNFLPNGGNGTYTFTAIATDANGNQITLGTKTVTSDNVNAVTPFGAIDQPEQGGTATGTGYLNWGWALTPPPNTIPMDGSTLYVWIDGMPLAEHPEYNLYRDDVATRFPNYNNSSGGVGLYYLDTTLYDDGVHTIAWSVTDDGGNSAGIGSRYFSIVNGLPRTSSVMPRESSVAATRQVSTWAVFPTLKQGYDMSAFPETLVPGKDGAVEFEIKESGRIELSIAGDNPKAVYYGYLASDKKMDMLPVGSVLDQSKGIFYWQPGPGFIGSYRLVFLEQDEDKNPVYKVVKVTILSKFGGLVKK
ncbi:MAG: choice-of-anchor D domain-containing protein [bacterium]|nr:choice-of-anchor D domain-containing protein [bacterium]